MPPLRGLPFGCIFSVGASPYANLFRPFGAKLNFLLYQNLPPPSCREGRGGSYPK